MAKKKQPKETSPPVQTFSGRLGGDGGGVKPQNFEEQMDSGPPIKRIVFGVIAAIIVIFCLFSTGSLWENVDAKEIVVIQHPTSGKLTFCTDPGVYWQGWGKTTRYNKREQFWFAANKRGEQEGAAAIKIRFNDGGHADVSGSVAWELPLDEANLTELHTKYGSMQAIEQQLIRTTIERSIYMTGPLMSSAESYAARRNELLNDIDDQIRHGVYKTIATDERQKDQMTGAEKTVKVVKLLPSTDAGDHGFAREGTSPISEFGVATFNLSITEITYDDTVEAQIQAQQKATMEVQTAMANAKKSEQEVITVQKQGEADAARAKWEQEVIKAKTVTEAEQRRDIAKLDKEAAEFEKQKQILLGQGEAARRTLVMEADGALDKKLEAWVRSQELWAAAIGKYQGALVPQFVMGSNGNGGVPGAPQAGVLDFMTLLTAKAAKDLSLDMAVTKPVHAASDK